MECRNAKYVVNKTVSMPKLLQALIQARSTVARNALIKLVLSQIKHKTSRDKLHCSMHKGGECNVFSPRDINKPNLVVSGILVS